MHIACANGYLQIVVYLKYEIDLPIDELDIQGKSPAHLAIQENKEALTILLIAWGIPLNIIDSKNNTLLHYAATSNNYRLSRLMIIRGASRDAKNNEGLTPYQIAKQQGYEDLCKILVRII